VGHYEQDNYVEENAICVKLDTDGRILKWNYRNRDCAGLAWLKIGPSGGLVNMVRHLRVPLGGGGDFLDS
jgi:hypothetical protein